MTKILKIEGTDIRVEIEECEDCPMNDDERGVCNLPPYNISVINGCPLPEKTVKK